MKQLALPLGLDPSRGFDTYVTGQNAQSLAVLRTLAAGGGDGAPVYLWGPPGCGKTHLLHAVAGAWEQAGGRVMWVDETTPLDHDELETARWLLVLDDCERYDPARQHAAFALFVEATQLAWPVLAAGALPPVDLPLRDDLRTRLGWGHVLALAPLSEDDTRAALRREAEQRGLALPEDLIDYLLRRFARDLKHLTALLDRLDAYALVEKRAPTVPLLRQMLAERATPDPLTEGNLA